MKVNNIVDIGCGIDETKYIGYIISYEVVWVYTFMIKFCVSSSAETNSFKGLGMEKSCY